MTDIERFKLSEEYVFRRLRAYSDLMKQGHRIHPEGEQEMSELWSKYEAAKKRIEDTVQTFDI